MFGLLYMAFFFCLVSLILVLPELMHVLESMPPGPVQEEVAKQAAKEAAKEAIQPRIYLALALAAGLTAGGGYLGVLPGLKVR